MDRINQRTNHLLGYNIKRLRQEHNLKNRDVIAKLQLRNIEIYRSTYSKVEMGLNNPTVDMIIALADIYQCSFDEFFKPIPN
ncbi:MAG: helix-turn-helix transcriptional regulator [Lachnospiraceae bacterium]|nr:helix-turn-helix transcriptional regulator [Lachnospiraceae bacterium]